MKNHPNLDAYVSIAMKWRVKTRMRDMGRKVPVETLGELIEDTVAGREDDPADLTEPFVITSQLRLLLKIVRATCPEPQDRLVLYACGEENKRALPLNPSVFDTEERHLLQNLDRHRYETLFHAPEGDHTQVIATIFGLTKVNVRAIKSRAWEAVFTELIRKGLQKKPKIRRSLLVAMLSRNERWLPDFLRGRQYMKKTTPDIQAKWDVIRPALEGAPVILPPQRR
jgi:hypothetical protein